MPLDAAALARALELRGEPPVNTMLCQKELARFADHAAGDVVVACTQEATLFGDVAEEGGKTQAIRFVNIRETGGWSAEAKRATPKIAALLALAAMPDPEPVPRVAYTSQGQLLIAGPAEAALHWAQVLAPQLAVTVLVTGPRRRRGAAGRARVSRSTADGSPRLAGWLGAFEADVGAGKPHRPRPLHALQRLHPRVSRACDRLELPDRPRPLQVASRSASRPAARRRRSISSGATRARSEQFDLVLDLGRAPQLRMHQPPQGYFAPGADPVAQAKAVTELAVMVGEFEKPKYFVYKASICAHSRSRQPGCNQCIDVCSTEAIAADGDGIKVEPHLCMGCGACATVCPSGALRYAYPSAPDLGTRLKVAALDVRARRRPRRLPPVARRGRAPADRRARAPRIAVCRRASSRSRSITSPRSASTSGSRRVALGASQVAVLATDAVAPEYLQALERQMRFAETIAQALGYQGEHFRTFAATDAKALDAALWSWPAALSVRVAGDLRVHHRQADDRGARRRAPRPACAGAADARSRCPPARRSARIVVNKDACTMCLACIGACPEGALLDNPEAPQLRFIESKCVQCGSCEKTCPEDAIALAAAAVARAGGEGAARPQRGGDLHVHRLRQAARHRADDRDDAGAPRRPLDVRRAGRSQPAQDVRRLPRHRPDEGSGRAWTSAMSDAAHRRRRRRSRRKTRRGPISTRCWRGSSPHRPTQRCWRRSPRRPSLGTDVPREDDAAPRPLRRLGRAARRQRDGGSRRPFVRNTTIFSSASARARSTCTAPTGWPAS